MHGISHACVSTIPYFLPAQFQFGFSSDAGELPILSKKDYKRIYADHFVSSDYFRE